ncbi:MAG: archaeosortase/exosortase family protein [Bacteroidetes bacterium]|nr:archaeosortase/exosortase family protein [Bacteroidota bacterium]
MKDKTTQGSKAKISTKEIHQKSIPKSKVLVRFLGLFALLFIGFELCYFNDFLYNHFFLAINKSFAFLTAKSLTLLGIPSKSMADSIANEKFSITVKQGCDSMEALAIFVCGVMAFPSNLKVKLYGLLIGTFIIFGFNLIRLISLFWIGLNHHDLFDLFHLEIWQGFFIILSIVLWVLWVLKASQPNKTIEHATT